MWIFESMNFYAPEGIEFWTFEKTNKTKTCYYLWFWSENLNTVVLLNNLLSIEILLTKCLSRKCVGTLIWEMYVFFFFWWLKNAVIDCRDELFYFIVMMPLLPQIHTQVLNFFFLSQHLKYSHTLQDMATFSSPSTYVDIDAPSISIPIWPPPVQTQTLLGLPPHDPTMYNISTPPSFAFPGTQVRMLSPVLGGSTLVQPLTWAPQHDSMQMCTSLDGTSSMAQHDLPGILPTPGTTI